MKHEYLTRILRVEHSAVAMIDHTPFESFILQIHPIWTGCQALRSLSLRSIVHSVVGNVVPQPDDRTHSTIRDKSGTYYEHGLSLTWIALLSPLGETNVDARACVYVVRLYVLGDWLSALVSTRYLIFQCINKTHSAWPRRCRSAPSRPPANGTMDPGRKWPRLQEQTSAAGNGNPSRASRPRASGGYIGGTVGLRDLVLRLYSERAAQYVCMHT